MACCRRFADAALKALTYQGSKDVRVDNVADPQFVAADGIKGQHGRNRPDHAEARKFEQQGAVPGDGGDATRRGGSVSVPGLYAGFIHGTAGGQAEVTGMPRNWPAAAGPSGRG